ncbi:hypothetical protein EYB53_001230 [Candidatus Chloroploca sp. M-50]|uniref:Lipoprotein n=1 Tax=Candidatus Chloroploca mongolica TaxID=2528176 RepID=A0ABS4D4F9_9CHLR|nr:hypothetical protein [Candidatus Chloroploca mongolica]MBP1464319.1 hypothetical protein [Candidatus Chloroploca mongolica]
MRLSGLIIIALFVLTACGSLDAGTAPGVPTIVAPEPATGTPIPEALPVPEATLPPQPRATPVPIPPTAPPVTGEAPAELLERLLADVIARTGAEREAIVVVRDEAVVWSDGSLGCPEPGMMYTQALVEGYHVVFDVAGVFYDYRVDSRDAFRLCENAVGEPPTVAPTR